MIRTYDLVYVPSLLQTPDYARAVMQLAPGRQTRSEIERRVELRMRRQQLLFEGPQLLHLPFDRHQVDFAQRGDPVARPTAAVRR